MFKKLLQVLLLIFIALIVGGFAFLAFIMAPILNGTAAKNACSGVYVANLPQEKVLAEDLGFFPVKLASVTWNTADKYAESSLFGLGKRRAVYRDGFGCALVNDIPESELRNQRFTPKGAYAEEVFRAEDTLPYAMSEKHLDELNAAVDWAFTEETGKLKQTRAVVVVYKGKIVAERYAEGIDQNARLLGWSCTKSITASMLGLLAHDGKLSLSDAAPIPGWQGTEKEAITIQQLLQMNSGLSFNENYFGVSDVTQMLFKSDSMGIFAASRPLAHPPGTFWNYASGTTNIVAYLSSRYFESKAAYHQFPYQRLFQPLGMRSMLLETDGAGYFIGSSYAYATARDWAKFGLLYLNDGVWQGDTLLPKWWIDFVQQPATGSDSIYGGQFWLNAGGRMPNVPRNQYSMNGFHDQQIAVFPSQDLVVARFGLTYKRGDFDWDTFYSGIVSAIDKHRAQEAKCCIMH